MNRGEIRLLNEAPGHLFLDYEDAELASFLQLGIVNGWDMHVFPELAYGESDTARAVICHDDWIALHHRQDWAIKEWREQHACLRPRLLIMPLLAPPIAEWIGTEFARQRKRSSVGWVDWSRHEIGNGVAIPSRADIGHQTRCARS